MHNFSSNWRHLSSMLDGYATHRRRPECYEYTDHVQSKALAVFFAHAKLATPALDRTTVEALLDGRMTWPRADSEPPQPAIQIPLALLEEHGLVSFIAGWCVVHCQSVRNVEVVDPSLRPLIQAVEFLKAIRDGSDGYYPPHFTLPVGELEARLLALAGISPIAELLPQLRVEDGNFVSTPGNQNFDALVCTYLWQVLREVLAPRQAFERWLWCLRTHCRWAMPVIWEQLGSAEQREFADQLVAHLADDVSLHGSMTTLLKQAWNEHSFFSLITPVQITTHVSIGSEESAKEKQHEVTPCERLTLATLNTAYPVSPEDHSDALQFVCLGQRFNHWRTVDGFYSWLIASSIEVSVGIDGQQLFSWGTAESLLDLATTRPTLKYLLFNAVPDYDIAGYLAFLLSRADTCDIALFHLAQKRFSQGNQDSPTLGGHLDKVFQHLVCDEYLRALAKIPDVGERLLNAIDFLGDRCYLHTSKLSQTLEYQFLLGLLERLQPQQIRQLGQAYVRQLTAHRSADELQQPGHHQYLLGFWLLEHVPTASIDASDNLLETIQIALLSYYRAEFSANLAGQQRTLQPSEFFAALPWHKLIGSEGVRPLLALSGICNRWSERLSYSHKYNFAVGAAIRQYLQVLLQVGRAQKVDGWERVRERVAEIVRTLGFGPREEATYLFDSAFYRDEYDLWRHFCSYANSFPDSLFEDLLDRCGPLIPVDQLFVLLEHCSAIARAEHVQSIIAAHEPQEAEDLGLQGIEQAFTSACNYGNTAMALKLITSAKAFLAQERFVSTRNPHILRARRVWLTYEYKFELLELLETLKDEPEQFAEAARHHPVPFEQYSNLDEQEERAQRHECEVFKRYITAAAFCDTKPQRCVSIMEVLYKETKHDIHSFLLFKSRLAVHYGESDTSQIRYALAQFIASLGDTEPDLMPAPWVATILEGYRQLRQVQDIDVFWSKLSTEQQVQAEILGPYCMALIERNEPLIAQQIFNRYCELNPQIPEGLGLNDLINQLVEASPADRSLSQLIQIVNEDSQRTDLQLTKHYTQIVSKDFKEYVAIVGQGLLPHEFLQKAMLEVAQELVFRKKNLQLHAVESNETASFRITKEDLINDWFTSLFNKRMAEARVGINDQTRGGESPSGKSPGEIDGSIRDSKNRRIAIFEAFRLFSTDVTVITTHLDKIEGYDPESLSPVFIAAYCDVIDFRSLIRGYAELVAARDHSGYTKNHPSNGVGVEVLHASDNLWLGMERRWRGPREVVFYHILLNMRFRSATVTSQNATGVTPVDSCESQAYLLPSEHPVDH